MVRQCVSWVVSGLLLTHHEAGGDHTPSSLPTTCQRVHLYNKPFSPSFSTSHSTSEGSNTSGVFATILN